YVAFSGIFLFRFRLRSSGLVPSGIFTILITGVLYAGHLLLVHPAIVTSGENANKITERIGGSDRHRHKSGTEKHDKGSNERFPHQSLKNPLVLFPYAIPARR